MLGLNKILCNGADLAEFKDIMLKDILETTKYV